MINSIDVGASPRLKMMHERTLCGARAVETTHWGRCNRQYTSLSEQLPRSLSMASRLATALALSAGVGAGCGIVGSLLWFALRGLPPPAGARTTPRRRVLLGVFACGIVAVGVIFGLIGAGAAVGAGVVSYGLVLVCRGEHSAAPRTGTVLGQPSPPPGTPSMSVVASHNPIGHYAGGAWSPGPPPGPPPPGPTSSAIVAVSTPYPAYYPRAYGYDDPVDRRPVPAPPHTAPSGW